MKALTETRRIHRFYANGTAGEVDDDLIQEFRLRIRLDGSDLVEAVICPSLVEEFVIGYLVTRGLIRSMEDLTAIDAGDHDISVQRDRKWQDSRPRLTLLETTGSRNVDISGQPDRFAGGTLLNPEMRVPIKDLMAGVGKLAEMPLFNQTGGTHCAILFSPPAEMLTFAEDIGRHNAVDKVIGSALKKRIDFKACWLAVSGRLPADMVFKAVLAGIPLIASVSAATAEGVKTGERAGITVIGFTRRGRFNCYCHPERIT